MSIPAPKKCLTHHHRFRKSWKSYTDVSFEKSESDGLILTLFRVSACTQNWSGWVKSGFSPMQALQSATFNPALFLAELDKFGVVETGHAAHLVLLEANPLEDIRITREIGAVVLAGKYYSRQELDKILARIAEVARSRSAIAGAVDTSRPENIIGAAADWIGWRTSQGNN
jgi:hypothetical protein